MLSAPLSPSQKEAYVAYVLASNGGEPLEIREGEIDPECFAYPLIRAPSMLEDSVTAELLLKATPGESYLSLEDRARLGQTNKALAERFRREDRKVYYVRNSQCSSARCVCGCKYRNYCGMTHAKKATTSEKLQKEYRLSRNCMPKDYWTGAWNGGCNCFDTIHELEGCGRKWSEVSAEEEYNDRCYAEHNDEWEDSR